MAVGSSVLRVAQDAPAPAPAPPPPPAQKLPALRLVEGWETGARIPLEGVLVLGNEAAGSAEFGGDPAVAPEHARVTPLPDGRILLEDLGSPGGTLVRGLPIPAPVVLSAGDRFQLGGQTLELAEVARPSRAAQPDKAAGGVRPVPEGLFVRIAGRAPVTTDQVFETCALALGWTAAVNLFIRTMAIEVADLPSDLTILRPLDFVLITVLPVVFNSLGFAKIFRRPDYRSVRRYLIPTFGVPLLGILLNLLLMNHRGPGEYLTTIAITASGVMITAPLMLRLRRRVAMERLRQVRG